MAHRRPAPVGSIKMKLNSFISKVAIASALCLIASLSVTGTAQAQTTGGDGWICVPDTTQTGGVVICTYTGGGGSGGVIPINYDWEPVLASPGYGACLDKNGRVSYMTDLYNKYTGEVIFRPAHLQRHYLPPPMCVPDCIGRRCHCGLKSPGQDHDRHS